MCHLLLLLLLLLLMIRGLICRLFGGVFRLTFPPRAGLILVAGFRAAKDGLLLHRFRQLVHGVLDGARQQLEFRPRRGFFGRGLAKLFGVGILPLSVGIASVASHSEVGVTLMISVASALFLAASIRISVITSASVVTLASVAVVPVVTATATTTATAASSTSTSVVVTSSASLAHPSVAALSASVVVISSSGGVVVAVAPPAFSDVDAEGAILEECAVVLERLAQRAPVVELNVAEALELVRLFVPHESDGAHFEVLKHDVEVALHDRVGQVAHEGRVGRLVGDRPATSLLVVVVVASGHFDVRVDDRVSREEEEETLFRFGRSCRVESSRGVGKVTTAESAIATQPARGNPSC